MRCFLFILCLIAFSVPCNAQEPLKADYVVVVKSKEKLYLEKDGKIIRSYDVVLGKNPDGHKQYQGDQRTPEGYYTLDYKNYESAFYKSIRISYPNRHDIARAFEEGVHPGKDIFIHGQPNGWGWAGFFRQGYNWTDGCIALKNSDMDEIWQLVDVPTPIAILP